MVECSRVLCQKTCEVCKIVIAFEGDGTLVSNAKADVNDPNVAKLLTEIHCDY